MGFCPASASGRFCAHSRGHTPLLCSPALALSLSPSTGHLSPCSWAAPPPLPHGHWHYTVGQSGDTLVLSSTPGGAPLTQDAAPWGLSSLHGQPTWGHGETPHGAHSAQPCGKPQWVFAALVCTVVQGVRLWTLRERDVDLPRVTHKWQSPHLPQVHQPHAVWWLHHAASAGAHVACDTSHPPHLCRVFVTVPFSCSNKDPFQS